MKIFIVQDFGRPSPSVPHFCREVPDSAALLEKAKKDEAKVMSAKRSGRAVFFAEDFLGTRIDLKPQL